MNADKLRRMEEGLSSVARKVYDCTPMQEVWDVSQIRMEARRRGLNLDHSVVGGCLDSLKDAGLVRRSDSGYQRVSVRPKSPEQAGGVSPLPEASRPADVVQLVAPGLSKRDTLAALATIGREMRVTAERIIALSKEVDEAALLVEQRIAEINADAEKFRKVQALLQGVEK